MAQPDIIACDARSRAATLPMRKFVELYPETMEALAAHGFDLCCGGAHTIPEAARQHGIDADALLSQIETIVEQTGAAT